MDAVEKRDIIFLDNVNVVSNTTKELMMKMLTKDATKRISWKELFDRELTGADTNSNYN